MSHAPTGERCTCGEPGWMPGIEHCPIRWAQPEWIRSMAGKMQPVAVVDHIMQGYLRTMVNWASDGGSKIIAHFGVAQDGRTVQFQPVHTPGIHVSAVIGPRARVVLARPQAPRGANTYTIGIEHEGCSIDPRPAYTVPPDLIYSETNPWPTPMVESSIAIKVWCFGTVPSLGTPSRDSIIGHYEVDARNRPHDPAMSTARGVWPVEHMLEVLRGKLGSGRGEASVQEAASTHTVVRGETLGAIGRRYGVNTRDLARWNDLPDANVIEVDQVLRLTPPEADVEEVPVPVEGSEPREAEPRPAEPMPAEATANPPLTEGDIARLWGWITAREKGVSAATYHAAGVDVSFVAIEGRRRVYTLRLPAEGSEGPG